MRYLIIPLIATLLAGCHVVPKQLDDLGQDRSGLFQRLVEEDVSSVDIKDPSANITEVSQWWHAPSIALSSQLHKTQALQDGDLLRVNSTPFEELNGLYQITSDGDIELPFIGRIPVAGLSLAQAQALSLDTLRINGWYKEGVTKVQLSIVESAPVSVVVRGSVFNPGQKLLNSAAKSDRIDGIRQQTGSFTRAKSLFSALSSAGGIRPDADLTRIYLKRDESIYQYDLSSVITGFDNIQVPDLQNGDQIYVASGGYEQYQLIRPSAITPPGMRVFMSNLTAPGLSNSQSAIGQATGNVPYGVSMIDMAISANCVGGTQMANASRSIVLVTRNHGSSQQIIISRRIDDLLAQSSNPQVNPYIMPNDAIACYDSKFTNFRDVARGLGELISPFLLGRLL
ncbi:MAG: polysaccharide export outer membrane protein [Arenicella sp.]|jgi:polysaccharide export outer membrane protein